MPKLQLFHNIQPIQSTTQPTEFYDLTTNMPILSGRNKTQPVLSYPYESENLLEISRL